MEQGKFAVYAVATIDEAIELLTGQPAGQRSADGQFPANSVNYRVEQQLVHYAKQRRGFVREAGKDD